MKQFRFKEWPGVLWGICRKAPIFEGLMALKKLKKGLYIHSLKVHISNRSE